MAHYAPFKSLSPVTWATDIAPRDPSSLADLLTTTLSEAQLLIDSIPTPTPAPPSSNTHTPNSSGRARSHTDSAVQPPSSSGGVGKSGEGEGENKELSSGKGEDRNTAEQQQQDREATVRKLQREWKDLKVAQGDKNGNPHGIAMYKMAARDGRYAWFARRSLHRPEGGGGLGGLGGFDKWEAALRGEMQATLDKVAATPGMEPGMGNIRGIGAERRVETVECDAGTVDVYHVSARFPGPTAPRDFVPLIMMPKGGEEKKDGPTRTPRQFTIVSRPCEHPDCPPRSGFIRGTYESVEIIREVPVAKPLRKVRSSIDLNRDDLKGGLDGERIGKEAVLRAAKRAAGDEIESEGEGRTVSPQQADGGDLEDTEMAIEWLMVTRSDPGGSVPRFMVEKGTPGGIINDAGKFIKWLSAQRMDDLTKPSPSPSDRQATKTTGESPVQEQPGQLPVATSVEDHLPNGEAEPQEEPSAGNSANSSGIYGMFSSALDMATSAVASRVAAFAPRQTDSDSSDDESDISDASYLSAAEEGTQPESTVPDHNNTVETASATDKASTHSTPSTVSEHDAQPPLSQTPSATFLQAKSQHEKELGKLQSRMRKAQEKLERAQARQQAKNNNNGSAAASNGDLASDEAREKQKEKDDQALAKLREKHEKEIAKQEDKFRRETQRLADKRAAEERKAEARRKKAAEREERGNLAMELQRARAERDVARKEVDMLRERVGELQGQCTMLVARLGKEGIDVGALKKDVGI
ncbi:hypothetical protein N658DRAFT_502740 [Parathielavia hyrcaniae]|uniref:DUF3074 domain-containing protein n=1 Tax=Parathielavia hyrcaniae TaxID=113614 RepID=A0AAN6T6V2_9PEZI|nr:hypothetical protein N658DRAFT_502740 [Parathielavia hyrcaniae]